MAERRAKEADEPLAPEPANDKKPAIPAAPWQSYKEIVAQLAARIVDAQRPIRVLQARP